MQCGERRIRTSEVERQQIYSLPQLATLVSPRKSICKRTFSLKLNSETSPIFKGMQNYTLFSIIQIFKENSINFFKILNLIR